MGGTTGESPALERAELEQLISSARERIAGRIPLIAGSGTAGTAEERGLVAGGRGRGRRRVAGGDPVLQPADAGRVSTGTSRRSPTPCPSRSSSTTSPGAPPVTCFPRPWAGCRGIRASQASRRRPAAFRGVKRCCVPPAPGSCCSEATTRPAVRLMRAGARGVISVTANVAPRAMHEMCAAALRGEHDEAARIDATLAPLHEKLFVEPNPIPVKWAVHRMGLAGQAIRLPSAATVRGKSRGGRSRDAYRRRRAAMNCGTFRARSERVGSPTLRTERWPSGRRRWTGIPVTSSRVYVGSNPTLSATHPGPAQGRVILRDW